VPLTDDFARLSFMIEGKLPDPANRPSAFYNAVGSDYLTTLQLPLIRGRDFDRGDIKGSPNVVIISETLARSFFTDEDPIGKRITLDDMSPTPAPDSWCKIVGIVGDTKPLALDDQPAPEMYMPFNQQPEAAIAVIVRTASDPTSVAGSVREVMSSLDGELPAYGVTTLDKLISESVAQPRLRTVLLGLFAAIALLLAAVGIYGVMSYSVNLRTHEIGVRMALGARNADVIKLVVGNAVVLTLAGLGIGLAVSLAATRLISSLLFSTSETDVVTFAATSMLLAIVAIGSSLVPARRAMKVDPMTALRYE
jgi:putative ABC transport system permease protein